MEPLEEILKRHKVVFLDTSCFIYYFEDSLPYSPYLDKLFERIEQGQLRAVTSVITLLEILTKPLREGNANLSNEYQRVLLNARGLEVVSVTPDVAVRVAELRARTSLKTPDALQLSAALVSNCDLMITNDKKFKSIPDLEVLLLDELRGA